MQKALIIRFFQWWGSIHSYNISVCDGWLSLEQRLNKNRR